MVAKPARPGKQLWHAVSVVGRAAACPATVGLSDKRFLSDEAPPLPLPDCSSTGVATAFTCTTQTVAESFAGRRIAGGSHGLGSGERGESATDGGRMIKMINRNGRRHRCRPRNARVEQFRGFLVRQRSPAMDADREKTDMKAFDLADADRAYRYCRTTCSVSVGTKPITCMLYPQTSEMDRKISCSLKHACA